MPSAEVRDVEWYNNRCADIQWEYTDEITRINDMMRAAVLYRDAAYREAYDQWQQWEREHDDREVSEVQAGAGCQVPVEANPL